MSVSSIDNDSIGTGIHQSLHTVEGISSYSHSGSYTQTAFRVFASHRFIFSFRNIFISNQSYQLTFFIHNRQFLNSVFLQNLRNSFHIGSWICSNDIFFCHHFIDMLIHISYEAKVTISNNSYQISFIIYYWNTTDSVFCHQCQCISYSRTSLNGYRIINHTIFSALHNGNLTCLFLNGHILMNNADTTFTCNGNSHFRFSNRVHSGRYKRNFQLNVFRKLCREFDSFREYFRVSGD